MREDTNTMKLLLKYFFLFTSGGMLFAASKSAPDLPSANSLALVDCIVQYKTPPSKDELKQLGQVKKQFVSVKAVEAFVLAKAIPALESDPNVVYISPNRTTSRFLDITTATVNANIAW